MTAKRISNPAFDSLSPADKIVGFKNEMNFRRALLKVPTCATALGCVTRGKPTTMLGDLMLRPQRPCTTWSAEQTDKIIGLYMHNSDFRLVGAFLLLVSTEKSVFCSLSPCTAYLHMKR